MTRTQLQFQDCRPCRKSDLPLTLIRAQEYQLQVEEWSIDEQARGMRLVRTFELVNLDSAREFVRLVKWQADLQNHHPKIVANDNFIQIEWWTHIIDGLHENDFIMAAKTNGIFGGLM